MDGNGVFVLIEIGIDARVHPHVAEGLDARACAQRDRVDGLQINFGCRERSRRDAIGVAIHIGGDVPLAIGVQDQIARRLHGGAGANGDGGFEPIFGVIDSGRRIGARDRAAGQEGDGVGGVDDVERRQFEHAGQIIRIGGGIIDAILDLIILHYLQNSASAH